MDGEDEDADFWCGEADVFVVGDESVGDVPAVHGDSWSVQIPGGRTCLDGGDAGEVEHVVGVGRCHAVHDEGSFSGEDGVGVPEPESSDEGGGVVGQCCGGYHTW